MSADMNMPMGVRLPGSSTGIASMGGGDAPVSTPTVLGAAATVSDRKAPTWDAGAATEVDIAGGETFC
jgi:hypothetical protein